MKGGKKKKKPEYHPDTEAKILPKINVKLICI
jgi:hypothetical protein